MEYQLNSSSSILDPNTSNPVTPPASRLWVPGPAHLSYPVEPPVMTYSGAYPIIASPGVSGYVPFDMGQLEYDRPLPILAVLLHWTI